MPESILAEHLVEYDKAAEAAVCSCGNSHPGDYLAHIAALLGTDEAGAREALLKAHDNVEVNAGMCGGCDTCGSDSAMARCAICGEGYSPCATYYEALLDEDSAIDLPTPAKGQP